jgi:hypothetical protein
MYVYIYTVVSFYCTCYSNLPKSVCIYIHTYIYIYTYLLDFHLCTNWSPPDMAFPRSMGNWRYGTTPSGRSAARLPKFARLCGYPLMICSLAPRMVQGLHGTPKSSLDWDPGTTRAPEPRSMWEERLQHHVFGPCPKCCLGRARWGQFCKFSPTQG